MQNTSAVPNYSYDTAMRVENGIYSDTFYEVIDSTAHYTIICKQGDVLTIDVTLSPSGDGYLRLADPNHYEVEVDDPVSYSSSYSIEHTCSLSGEYWFYFSLHGFEYGVSEYDFTVTVAGASGSSTILGYDVLLLCMISASIVGIMAILTLRRMKLKI